MHALALKIVTSTVTIGVALSSAHDNEVHSDGLHLREYLQLWKILKLIYKWCEDLQLWKILELIYKWYEDLQLWKILKSIYKWCEDLLQMHIKREKLALGSN